MTTYDVVIVGAGPTGVTAASLLASYGVECLVLDRWSEVYPQPRAVHLDDEVYRILGRLGLAEEFALISRPAQGLRLLDSSHGVLAEFQRDKLVGVHGYPQANMFDQPELEEVLRRHLEKLATVTFQGDVDVVAVDQVAWDRVHVSYTDRTTGATETVAAAFVLGCDGANSVVRSSIGASMVDLGFEQRWLVVDVETDQDLDAWDGVHQVCDTTRAATYMRIGERRYRWEFQLHDGETPDGYRNIVELAPLLAPWTDGIEVGSLTLRRVAEYTFRAQIADVWSDRRVFILGDAAHLTPPFIGQGMGAGLRDALNLSWKIAGVLAGDLGEEWLATYEPERKPHAQSLIRVAIWMGRAMTQGGRLGDLARRVIAPRAAQLPGLRQQITDGATPPLHGTTVALQTKRFGGLAGTLCPHLPLTGGFVLVTSGVLDQYHRALVDRRGGTVIDSHPGDPLRGWLEKYGVRAALIRPDGTVMAAGKSAAALAADIPVFTSEGVS